MKTGLPLLTAAVQRKRFNAWDVYLYCPVEGLRFWPVPSFKVNSFKSPLLERHALNLNSDRYLFQRDRWGDESVLKQPGRYRQLVGDTLSSPFKPGWVGPNPLQSLVHVTLPFKYLDQTLYTALGRAGPLEISWARVRLIPVGHSQWTDRKKLV